jgi:hypothetical protein
MTMLSLTLYAAYLIYRVREDRIAARQRRNLHERLTALENRER